MSFFDFQKPKMIDVKKRLGILEKPSMEDGTLQDTAPGSSAESWVELAPSRNSLCSSIEACALEEKMEKDSRLSPVSTQSPMVEFDSLEQVKYKLIQDMLPPGKHTDWIWDWSSRPEILPPKSHRLRQYGSNLTTPPNSPEPDFPGIIAYENNKPICSFRLVVGFIVSNIVTFVIGATIGFVVCKKIIKQKQI